MPNTTFVIPIKIDSDIRLNNIKTTLRYLLKHTDGFIHLYEADDKQKFNVEIDDPRIKYEYHFSPTTEFHRTKIINEMLSKVDTPVVSNYDADVILPVNSYKFSESTILENKADVVYPYGFEQLDQRKISPLEINNFSFKESLNLSDLNEKNIQVGFCRFGHVQFFNTDVYRKGFMENENYKHWCPEDEERGIRFVKLGYRVVWFRSLIYHQEHPPSTLKDPINKDEIYNLHDKLLKMNKEELVKYYNKQDYVKKYKEKM